MGWGSLGKKGREKRKEVACGSVIECRSGLSWWVGGDDKVEWRAGGFREDYKAFGSLMPPPRLNTGPPHHLLPHSRPSHFFSCCFSVITKCKAYQRIRLFKCSLQCILYMKYCLNSTSLCGFILGRASSKIFVLLGHIARVDLATQGSWKLWEG